MTDRRQLESRRIRRIPDVLVLADHDFFGAAIEKPQHYTIRRHRFILELLMGKTRQARGQECSAGGAPDCATGDILYTLNWAHSLQILIRFLI